jgi:hypothetical protein
MATKQPADGNEWDGSYFLPDDAPAGETLPKRAARLPTQNGPAMRDVFAYLLDEDSAAPTAGPAPAAKNRKRK